MPEMNALMATQLPGESVFVACTGHIGPCYARKMLMLSAVDRRGVIGTKAVLAYQDGTRRTVSPASVHDEVPTSNFNPARHVIRRPRVSIPGATAQ